MARSERLFLVSSWSQTACEEGLRSDSPSKSHSVPKGQCDLMSLKKLKRFSVMVKSKSVDSPVSPGVEKNENGGTLLLSTTT